MAKKFFNKKVYNKRKNILSIVIISICVVGIIASFIITSTLTNRTPEDAVIKIKNTIYIDLFGDVPNDEVFFEELKNVDEDKIEIDFEDIDTEKVGKYDIEVKVYNKKYDVTVEVIDEVAPELVLKDLNISNEETYKASDFVEKCSDNSKEKCDISFYSDGVDQNGNKVDYSKYSTNGTYEIKISASDESGNQTVLSTKLIINNDATTETCAYGNLEYDQANTLAYIVGSNNCAIDLNLYQDESMRKPVIDIAETETNKLKTDINSIPDLTENLTINREINAILNNTGNGLVGYTLMFEVLESDGTLVVKYYINLEGNRVYVENPLGIQ